MYFPKCILQKCKLRTGGVLIGSGARLSQPAGFSLLKLIKAGAQRIKDIEAQQMEGI